MALTRTMSPVTTPRDPLLGTDRLLIDGTNLLHALAARPGAAPPAALIGRLRAAIPPSVAIELVFDGPPDRGMRSGRVASGVVVRHAGARSADARLLDLVSGIRRESGPADVAALLVVTDDRDLRARLRSVGARSIGAAWLIGRLERPKLAAPSVGNRRGPGDVTGGSPGPSHGAAPDDGDVRGWSPGRGATKERGNPRRAARSSGRMAT